MQEGDRVRAGDRLALLTDNDPEIMARLEREREADADVPQLPANLCADG